MLPCLKSSIWRISRPESVNVYSSPIDWRRKTVALFSPRTIPVSNPSWKCGTLGAIQLRIANHLKSASEARAAVRIRPRRQRDRLSRQRRRSHCQRDRAPGACEPVASTVMAALHGPEMRTRSAQSTDKPIHLPQRRRKADDIPAPSFASPLLCWPRCCLTHVGGSAD